MPLQFKNIAVGNLQDDVSGNNYAANKAVYILNLNNTLAQIFSDEAGTTPIIQDGVNNVTGAKGVFGFWVEAGDYFVQVGANKYRVSITGSDYFNNRVDETVDLIVDAVAGRGAYYPVGSFEDGFTYTDINQVGTFGGTDYYIYTGGLTNLPHIVTAGTDPTLSSDYARVFYGEIDNVQGLRDELNDRALYLTLAEVQAKTDLIAGQSVVITDLYNGQFEVVLTSDAGGVYYGGVTLIGGYKLKLMYSVYINPSWLGILPDGNDHSAMLTQLDSEMPNGTTLWFKSGTYEVRDVRFLKTLNLIGKGVLFKRPDNALDSSYIMDIAGSGSSVSMVNFDANKDNNVGHTGRAEGLRITGNSVNINDVDSSNTPSGGTRVGNCFYVVGDNVTLDLVSSSNAGYAAIRVDGDNCDINRFRITDYQEKGIVFNGKSSEVCEKFTVRNSLDCTSSSTNPSAVAGILIDSGNASATRLKQFNMSNVDVNLTGGITGSNGIKVVNVDDVYMSNITADQTVSTFASVRFQERVKRVHINNLTTAGELNFDAFDYLSIVIENSDISTKFDIGSPISGLYAREVKIDKTKVNGAVSGSIRIENWVGQNDTDGNPAERPTFDFTNLVQNASANTVPLLFLAVSSANVNPGDIVVAGLRVKQGRTTYTQMITGSSSTDRIIQRNLRDDSFGRVFVSASEPTSGTWKAGDTLVNPVAGAGQPKEITCTTAGAAGAGAVFKTSNVLAS